MEGEMSDGLRALLERLQHENEFAIPQHFFSGQEKILSLKITHENDEEKEFKLPPGYFTDVQNRILAAPEIVGAKEDEAFFEEQEQRIVSLLKLNEMKPEREEFSVPENYFESSQAAIRERSRPVVRTFYARRSMWISVAAAACVVFAVIVFWPSSPIKKDPSFAELLDKTELDENDLFFLATAEDLDDMLMGEIELLTDTTITPADTVSRPKSITPRGNGLKEENKNPKNKKETKPSEKKKTPSFDDLSEEEILEYLLEEGSGDLDDL